MSGFLGNRIGSGRLDPENPVGAGNWTVTFQPSDFQVKSRFLIKHISLKGPSGSSFQVFIDSTFYDTSPRGDLNSWDPSQPLFLHPGQTLYFFWDTAATDQIPQVTVQVWTV